MLSQSSMAARPPLPVDAGNIHRLMRAAFLSGLRTNYTYLGMQFKFEILYELFTRARFQYMKTSKQKEDLSFVDDSNQEFYFSVYMDCNRKFYD